MNAVALRLGLCLVGCIGAGCATDQAEILNSGTSTKNWVFREGYDGPTKQPAVLAAVPNQDGAVLLIGCRARVPAVIVISPGIETSEGEPREISWQMDDLEPVIQTWRDEPTIRGGVSMSGTEAFDLMEKIRDGDNLGVATGDDAVGFELDGAEVMVDRVNEACGFA